MDTPFADAVYQRIRKLAHNYGMIRTCIDTMAMYFLSMDRKFGV
jgi:hypothetical protein